MFFLSVFPSYAATFEENRIGKDMLLDLDKVSGNDMLEGTLFIVSRIIIM